MARSEKRIFIVTRTRDASWECWQLFRFHFTGRFLPLSLATVHLLLIHFFPFFCIVSIHKIIIKWTNILQALCDSCAVIIVFSSVTDRKIPLVRLNRWWQWVLNVIVQLVFTFYKNNESKFRILYRKRCSSCVSILLRREFIRARALLCFCEI